jgi:aconitate hydratase
LQPGSLVDAVIEHADGSKATIELKHTMTDEQVGWFRAGSALNLIRERSQS